MPTIQDIPQELLEQLLFLCDPLDVAAFAQSCRPFRALIYNAADDHLWRQLYLCQPFDDPRQCITHAGIARSEREIDWKGELQRIIRARTIARDIKTCPSGERIPVLQTFLAMVSNAPVLHPEQPPGVSRNLIWVVAILRGATFFSHNYWTPSSEERLLRARLHTYFGLALLDIAQSARVSARSVVYNFQNYSASNDFGPFLTDGSGKVNWEHIKAIQHVVLMQVLDLIVDDESELGVFPMSMHLPQAVIRIGMNLDEMDDWAGVEGVWQCAFCFMDHRELQRFNNGENPDQLDPSIFEKPEFNEAFRSVDVNLRITTTEPDPEHPTRPRIHFLGDMGDHSVMSGWVGVTPDEQIRWHFISGDQGMSIWSSEGIQIGGIQSKFGVLGAWSTVFHDADDPVGPFWLSKAYEP